MYRPHLRKLSSFAFIGLSVFAGVQLVVTLLVDGLYWLPMYASAFTLAISIWVNYRLNQHFTWQHHESRGQAARFIMSRLGTLVLTLLVLHTLLSAGMHYQPANVIGVVIGMGANFVLADRWVFLARPARNHSVVLGWRSATTYLAAIVGFIALLRLMAAGLFTPMLFVSLSALAFGVAVWQLVAVLYGMRHINSYANLRPDASSGEAVEYFAALMPAREELDVYLHSILKAVLTQQEHPNHRFFPVVCDDDTNSIRVALTAITVLEEWVANGKLGTLGQLQYRVDQLFARLELNNHPLSGDELQRITQLREENALVQVIILPLMGLDPSKPLQLNYAFRLLEGEGFSAFTIIDAESMVQGGLYRYVDRVFQDNPDATVIQGAVQLIDPTFSGTRWQRLGQSVRRWYSWLNLLEYYRLNNGQLPFEVDNKFAPLCGNTLFIRTEWLRKTGGWPLTLTEDCHLGLLLSAMPGVRILSFNDPALATREETPPTLGTLIRQRTRWTQGFLQSYLSGEWRNLPTARQRLLAVWILANPFLQALSAPLLPLTVAIMVWHLFSSPPVLVLLMFVPLLAMGVGGALQLIQLHDYGVQYDRHIAWYVYLQVMVTQTPYQWVLSYAAFRAVFRQFSGQMNWERTARAGDLIRSSPSAALEE